MARSPRRPTPVVGVGASAGGLEALEGFFRGIPPEPGFGVVVVTHLSPTRESFMAEILARHTTLSVVPVTHDVEVKANCVYVLSTATLLGIQGGRLQVAEEPTKRRERKPIDIFLSALAKDLGEYSAAAILSGGDGDGALGVKAIKERGGMTLAQVHNGDGPTHPDMPNSAISTGLVDFAVPAHEMGPKLVEFVRSLRVLDNMVDSENGESDTLFAQSSRNEIYALLRSQMGHDFSGYKTKTFLRRVQRRMQVSQRPTLDGYLELLRQDAREVHALFRDLLINVTNFFRDADAFEKLRELVIPKLFEGRDAEDTVRIWVPGCATGEEVYSIAILVREHLDAVRNQPKVQIFATDIDEHSLNVARAARYPEALLDTVSPARLERFFVRNSGSYLLSKDVRDMCVFSPHSVIRDPPFSRIDLVSCRNLLIYFGPEVQSQVIPTFHYSLRSGGFLFLGTSENVSQFSDLFIPLEKKHRIFRARDAGATLKPMPIVLSGGSGAPGKPQRGLTGRSVMLRQSIESQIIERFAPAHVVTDGEGEIVYYSPRTGKYLEAAAGAPTRQLLSLARRGLRLDLRTVFREAVATGAGAVREKVTVEDDEGRVQFLTIRVEPFRDASNDEKLFVILFLDEGETISRDEAAAMMHRSDGSTSRLDAELRETRERLQAVVEEYETALEELKSSNEELVSVNEELQSTNEELEASKEELQSLNEELHTVNAELNNKVDALDSANDDLQNLFANTQVATIFLDSDLRIRTFTPAVSGIFNILASDRGRPLTDLSSHFPLPTLAEDVRLAATHGESSERRLVHETAHRRFLVRAAPYRDASERLAGAVVTFVDVTSVAEMEQLQERLIGELNHRIRNLLSVAIGLAQLTRNAAGSVEEFADALISRLHAMGQSLELRSTDGWGSVDMGDLVRRELAPFPGGQIALDGADLQVPARHGLALGLIIHELATNAAKYGALSVSGGTIEVTWRAYDGQIEFSWIEQGVDAIPTPFGTGFGMRLIRAEVSQTLAGHHEVSFQPPGLSVRINFPLGGKDLSPG